MADNKMEKSIKEAIGKSLNEFNKRIGMAKLIKDNKNQDRILKGILSQVNDENIEKTEKSNVITLDNSTDGIVELQEIKGDTNVNVSKMEKETPITHVIDDKNGNVISLDGITEGAINIDNIQGDTMVNCNKDTDKELILMPNLDTNGYSNITLTQGIDGGKVDVSLEGNTMVNVCDQEDPIAITKSYTVETGNHIALQGEYDGKCRPNIYGDTLVNIAGNSNLWEVGCNNKESTTVTITSTNAQGIVVNKLTDNVDYFYLRKKINPSLFKPSTTYTIIFNSLNVINVGILSGDTLEKILSLTSCTDGYNAIKFTSTSLSTITGKNNIYIYLQVNKQFIGTVKASNVIVLEGDYTNKPIPDYFTGMKSSFEDKLVPENLNVENLWVYSTTTFNRWQLDGQLLTSTPKTLYNGSGKIIYFEMNSDIQGTQGTWLSTTPIKPGEVKLLNTPLLRSLQLKESDGWTSSLDLTGLYLVEGDYTNYDFTNYDSTKGGKYKVDYKVTGKNLIAFTELGDVLNKAGEDASSTTIMRTSYIFLKANHTYYITNPPIEGSEWFSNIRYDKNKNFIGETYENNETITPKEDMYLRIKKHNPNQLPWNIQLEEGTTATTYEPYKESIKTLYLNSPLLEGDTIEQSGNNIIHNHRYGKVVLDGSDDENWSSNGDIEKTYFKYICNKFNKAKASVLTSIGDKLPTISTTKLKTGIIENTGTGKIQIGCDISTLDEFKSWLQQNPITVVYELAQPTQEIISTNDNLLLDSYTNGHLDVDSVIPIDKVEFGNADIYLKYVNANTDYTIQFESDNVGKVDIYNGSGYLQNINVTKGLNKVTITSDNNGYRGTNWSGIGFNASKIVVTPKVDNNFGYFKGMKSVGECEGNKIEILSQNKNLFDGVVSPKFAYDLSFNVSSNGVISATDKNNDTRPWGYEHSQYYVKLKKGDYTVTLETITPSTSSFSQIMVFPPKGDKIALFYNSQVNTIGTYKANFTLIEDLELGIEAKLFDGTYRMQIEKGNQPTSFIPYSSNKKEILLNEPLRGLPNGVKDKYVIIDGKWYIERNCKEVILNGSEDWIKNSSMGNDNYKYYYIEVNNIYKNEQHFSIINFANDRLPSVTWHDMQKCDKECFACENKYFKIISKSQDIDSFKQNLSMSNITVICQLAQPTYEPIDYNPFEVYTDTTHISNNSNIPCNMVIRNSGFNCILKPNTTYTVSSSNGLSTVTTKDSIGDSVLRFYNKDTSKITKMNNVLVLEGDYITGNPPIPAFFEGMESAFEQELVTDENNEHYGKYKVTVKAVGKNLFNPNNVLLNKYINDSNHNYVISNHGNYNIIVIPVINKDKIVISINSGVFGITRWEDINGNLIKGTNETYRKSNVVLTPPSTNCILKVAIDKSLINNNIQVEQGTKATEYESYKENNITFYINEPLRGVGDIKDKVYVKEDKVVVERNCGSVTFDGSSDEYWQDKWNNGFGIKKHHIFHTKIKGMKKVYGICNMFTNGNLSPLTGECVLFTEGGQDEFGINIKTLRLPSNDINGFRQWLQNNPTTVVYQLATPVYEEVEYSNNRLTLNTYNNSTLFYNSNIPVSNTSFKPLWEELIYIKNSTTYYIQFNAVGNGNVVVNLGGTELTTTITEGYNKIEITTPNNSTNLLTIDGQGIKISKVVVSEALCSGYYKGLQSCFEEHMENGKYVCVIRGISLDGNKVNGIKFYLNEPLRGIGDIKDRLCIKDGKLMVERKFSSITFDGSEDENWSSTGYGGHATRNTFEIALANTNGYKGVVPSISNLFINEQVVDIPINDNAFRVYTNAQNNTYFLFTPSTDIIPYRDTNKWKKWLQQNPIIVVYQLATPVYEEVTNEYGLPIILEGYENGIVYVDSSVTPTTSIKYTSNNKVPATLTNIDNLNTTTQNDINNNIVTYMMDIDMMLTEMEMDDSASSVMSLSDSDDNNQNHDNSHSNILDRMNKEDRIKYQDNTTKMLEKVIKGKSLTKEENINRIDLYLSEGKIRKEQSNYLKELLKGVE